MNEIWMLGYETKVNIFGDLGTYAATNHGYFTSKSDAQAKIDSFDDALTYFPLKCEPGQTFEPTEHSDPTPLDFSDYPEDFYFREYPTEAPLVGHLRPLAQFGFPNKETEALKFICDYANHDYTFESGGLYEMSAWVSDAIVKIITGENYPAFLAYTKNGEEGPETYSWQGENVTVKNCPEPRELDLDYASYIVPGTALTALSALYANMTDGAHHIQFGINLAARILTGPNYDRLVADSKIEWIDGIPG